LRHGGSQPFGAFLQRLRHQQAKRPVTAALGIVCKLAQFDCQGRKIPQISGAREMVHSQTRPEAGLTPRPD
jgi:hypothetical protein